MTRISDFTSGTPTLADPSHGVRQGAGAQGPTPVVLEATAHLGLTNPGAAAHGTLGARQNIQEPPVPPKAHSMGLWKDLGSVDSEQISTDLTAFMAAFAKFGQEMRSAARLQRHAEMQSQVSALQSSADEMRKAASERFKGALAQAGAQMGGGLLQAGLSVASAVRAGQGAKHDDIAQGAKQDDLAHSVEHDADVVELVEHDADVVELVEHDADVVGHDDDAVGLVEVDDIALDAKHDDIARRAKQDDIAIANTPGRPGSMKGQLAFHEAGTLGSVGQAASGMAGSAGGFASSTFNEQADKAEADKAARDAKAKVHETGVQQEDAMMQQAMEIIRDVREKLGAILQAENASNESIARNI